MRRRARAAALEGPRLRVGHVGHVIWCVEVSAVPAGWEAHVGHYADFAGFVGEVHALFWGWSVVSEIETQDGRRSITSGKRVPMVSRQV